MGLCVPRHYCRINLDTRRGCSLSYVNVISENMQYYTRDKSVSTILVHPFYLFYSPLKIKSSWKIVWKNDHTVKLFHFKLYLFFTVKEANIGPEASAKDPEPSRKTSLCKAQSPIGPDEQSYSNEKSSSGTNAHMCSFCSVVRITFCLLLFLCCL